MKFDGQLRYAGATKTKVQFHYSKEGSKTQSKSLELEKLSEDLRDQLAKKPDGIKVKNMSVSDTGRLEFPQDQPAATGFAKRGNRPVEPPQVIERIDGEFVIFESTPRLKREKVNVTDSVLGCMKGNIIEGGKDGLRLLEFGSAVDGLARQIPDIDKNPYNFVEFVGDKPWTSLCSDLTHAAPMDGRLSGVLNYKMEALTPVFVPEGFPFGKTDKEADEVRGIPRHFCRLRKGTECHYAIPGSSLKGMLRTEIEALSNSRMGIELDEVYFKFPIPYRRRSFQAGIITGLSASGKGWDVQPVEVLYLVNSHWPAGIPAFGKPVSYRCTDKIKNKVFAVDPSQPQGVNAGGTGTVIPYVGGLLVAPNNKQYRGLILVPNGSRQILSDATAKHYRDNLDNPHYKKHPDNVKPGFYTNVNASQLNLNLTTPNELIYYTSDGTNITTFGKNINYIWPSLNDVKKLTANFPAPPTLGLGDELCMAERLFGFSGTHTKDRTSHPFRGLLRFETAWGPKAADYKEEQDWPELSKSTPDGTQTPNGWKIALAPLTGPQTRAKSRPLYLQPGADKKSASWEDPKPKLRGRKFYWPQSDPQRAGKIWLFNLRDEAHVKSQLPPPVYALKDGTQFEGRIHFRNLLKEELGALVFALQGADDGKGYNHTLRIGKGKPRGLGNMKCEVVTIELDQSPELLLEGKTKSHAADISACVVTFQAWVKANAKKEFWESDYIKDYRNLHHWKEGKQIRYYPINFAQYGWLPEAVKSNTIGATNTKGEPDKRDGRPIAMKRARDL